MGVSVKLIIFAAGIWAVFALGNSVVATILTFILILGLLVFVHELGHFIMAKRAGMKVEEFGFGFPPRMFGVKRGETTYSINWIPLGGFVKILGENGDSTDPGSFASKPFWPRFAVLIAGVTMNAILAWVLISIGMMIGLPTVIYEDEQLPQSAKIKDVRVGILEVAPESPAAAAGIKLGDMIVRIANEPIDSVEEAQALTKAAAGQPTVYEISRGAEHMEKVITPRANPPEGQGALGVALGSIGRVAYPFYEAIPRGFVATFNLIVLTLTAFWGLISGLFQGQPMSADLAGPVGIAVLTRDVTQLGFIYLLQFTAVLSVNLAIINAVPFPALDGGRILFLIVEKIRGRKLNATAEQVANSIGFGLLLLLMVFVTVKDVSKYSEGFKNLFQKLF